MIGIVIVSHSVRLAEGVIELARDMAGSDVPLAAAGGLALPDQPLGTDANLILEAISRVYSDEGVLVLMDMGSAILSAEMALDHLPPQQRPHVVLCEAPLVEGALVAAVQARLGASLEQVIGEARGSLAAKTSHLSTVIGTPANGADTRQRAGVISLIPATHALSLTVNNRLGLHARPAARFVQVANRFPNVDIFVQNMTVGRGPANAKSINALASLGVRQGHEILILSNGTDAPIARAALRALADANFGEKEEVAHLIPKNDYRNAKKTFPESTVLLQGIPASAGIALGSVHILRREIPEISMQTVVDADAEWSKLSIALKKTQQQIRTTRESARRRAETATAIFDTHLLFLEDDTLLEPARQQIFGNHLNAAAAWQEATQSVIAKYELLDDEYLRQRAADLKGIGQQVLFNLLGKTQEIRLSEPCILLADDLTSTETVQLQSDHVLAICTARGGPTSHSAILARTFNIPAVVGLGDVLMKLDNGTRLIVDGESGQIFPNPAAGLWAEYEQFADKIQKRRAAVRTASSQAAVTRDGRRIEVVANIGSVSDARRAASFGAEGVGLFRTEFLFLDRQTAPDEDEQYRTYRAAAEAMQGRPMVIRTLDIGGDKPLPYVDFSPEANPFLGQRGIRICLAQPELLKPQLRAVLRVAAEFPIKLMFPMIATLTEWRAACALLSEARSELMSRHVPVSDRIETGMMVEIPSVAIQAAHFAPEVDFFSIGTNDLTQYTLAAERGNAQVAALSDALSPAVLHLTYQVIEAAHTHGKWVGICGELASDPLAVPLLVGLGVDELSIGLSAIPETKQMIRSLTYEAEYIRAQEILALETAEAVREYLRLHT